MADPVLVAKRVLATFGSDGTNVTYADATEETAFPIKPGSDIYVKVSLATDSDTPRQFTVAKDKPANFPTPYEPSVTQSGSTVTRRELRPYPIVEWKVPGAEFKQVGKNRRYSKDEFYWWGTIRNLPPQGMPPVFAFGVASGTDSPVEVVTGNVQVTDAIPPALLTFGGYENLFPWDYEVFTTEAYDTTLVNRTIQAGAIYKLGTALANDAQKADIVWVRQRLNFLLGTNKTTVAEALYNASDGKITSVELFGDLNQYYEQSGMNFGGTIDSAVFTTLQIPTDSDGNLVGPPTAASQSATASLPTSEVDPLASSRAANWPPY